MKKNKIPIVASFFPHINDLYHKRILQGIQQAAVENNINLMVYSLNNDFMTHFDNNIYNLLNIDMVDGLILCNHYINTLNNNEIIDFIKKFNSIPIINIGKVFQGVPSVTADNYQGMFDLIEHFIQKHNSKNIVFIHGGKGNEDANTRFKAYKDVLQKNNIIFNPDLIIYSHFCYENTIKDNFNHFLNKKIPFDTIICSNDLIAHNVLKVLKSKNIIVPDDVLLSGFDDMENSKYSLPPLTTVIQQEYKQGKTALLLMNDLIMGKSINKRTVIPAIPIFRKSCGCNLKVISSNKNNIYCSIETSLKIITKNEIIKIVTDYFTHPYINKSEFIGLISQIYEAYMEEMNNNEDQNKFSDRLNIILKNDFIKFEDFSIWEKIITFLNRAFDVYQDDKLLLKYKHKYIFEKAINTFMEFETVIFQEKQINYFYLTESIIYSFNKINSTMNQAQLPDAIETALNTVNINSCYISLFDTANHKDKNDISENQSFLYFYYKHKKKQNNKRDLFPAINLVPDNIDLFDTRKTYIMYLLNFNDKYFGSMLLECNINDFFVYEVLQSNISNALKGADLIHEQIKAGQEIEKLSRQKINFFINMAHEMKTPLTIINNYFDKYLNSNDMNNELSLIKYNFDNLKNNMTNILDLEKIGRSGFLYNHETIINLSNTLYIKSKLFQDIAGKKEIVIDTYIEKEIYIKINPDAFDRIINNLLDNAVKYTNNSGMIQIVLVKNENNTEVQIKDTGIGISKQKQKLIFNPYYQISHKKSNFQGLGIGLNIVRKIVNEINAEISVKSELNKGSVFKIIFENYELKKGDKIHDKQIPQAINVNVNSIKLQNEEYEPGRHNIFLVEDNPELLTYLQMELFNDYNVFYAFNGKNALKKLNNIPKPDLIISDIMMDVMDGYQFYDILLKNNKYMDIPFIFLSAISSFDERIKGLEKGAVDFISKPFKMKELLAKINSILKNQDAQKESNIVEIEGKIHDLLRDNINLNNNKFYNFKKKCDEYGITNKEREIIKQLLKGYEYKEIGSLLDISTNTVKSHIANIYRKCGVQNKIELSNIIS